MNDAINELVARWAKTDGLPFKGQLISGDGCMCAQGQALHYVGGYSADDLRAMTQEIADKETARLLSISTAHAVLLRKVNDSVAGAPSIVLTHPEKVLGDQAQTVLAFWRHLDKVTPEARAAAWALARAAARDSASDSAWVLAWAAAGASAREAACDAACDAASDAAWDTVWATNEIQGAAIMRKRGRPFFFLPIFGFATPEAILEGGAK